MMFYVVPNELRDAINANIDAALVDCPDAAADREIFYAQLLEYFNEHGVVPTFTLQKKVNADVS